VPNKKKYQQKRHFQKGQRLIWNGRWEFDEEPGYIDHEGDLKVEILEKVLTLLNGQRVFRCRIYDGQADYIGLTFYINECNLKETL